MTDSKDIIEQGMNLEISEDKRKEIEYQYKLRDKYLENYDVIGQHTAKHWTGERDEAGKKIYKEKGVYTGIFPQLRLRKLWKSDNKYNPDGTLVDPVAEQKRQEYLAAL